MKMSINEIKQAIHKADLMLRPYILAVNPSKEDKFKQVLKDTEYENMVIVQPDSAVEMGKAFLIDRKKLEDSALPKIDFNCDKSWAHNRFGYTWSELE